MGQLDGRTVRTGDEAHVALIAPTRAGKTTRYVIPWLLEHDGPAIVTSTKTDVLEATEAQRRGEGRVWIFDPFGPRTAGWDPLDGCASWSQALRQAQWLADASAIGENEIATYWRGEAAKLIAPLLHAAALSEKPVTTVLDWLDTQDVRTASRALLARGSERPERQLRAIAELDDRNKGTTFMSAGSVFAAYRYPEVLDGCAAADLNVDAFFDGKPNTLYLVAAERDQQLLRPLIATQVSALLHAAPRHLGNGATLRVLLDEAANIAPLRELPTLLSQGAGHGIRVATVWQSVAQLEDRYGTRAHTILANSGAKLVTGATTDRVTRDFVLGLLDSDDDLAGALRVLELGRTFYAGAGELPVVVRSRPSAAGRTR